ncbi:hypothetical protein GLOIN_2v1844789 [Rhizophagus irregularis DAOM 181602=DAOM 197198]|uniref:Uncharacterized protein n=1 Tax=Rhizophagus irregularis (strain DAOM 181602 / DAOM 197198 / MUCL 43194) TaxID=747089 RepID=A0A2P4PIX9_RHIID|nr:hypothetical protein GLOIN_2v1844789 [Rhizophagus irregularis DAOM 181602=DAOM 197198]POG65351.1 hypothetical protein GLOIN_2v1844789 [Rhizophagus irregularis DAOM 181602=DAOM 197198]GBC19974.2 hypothetical protein GLOIN_2v1844789 [Rhizophagus irregularis DAOM 181602=DAOM 197198]|eukprot:XP_025172217.1 hypothetical protein GLOIN_2v1844789 [Rhizophagus irregularis DAOM 181602=DAOM 197198]
MRQMFPSGLVEYYKKHISQYGSLKKILYDINIKLKQIVADSDSNSMHGETSQYIIDNWKNMQNDEPKTNHKQNENFKISDIDLNIFSTETGETELLNPVQKYLKNLSCLGIIHISTKVCRPEWIKSKNWDYL